MADALIQRGDFAVLSVRRVGEAEWGAATFRESSDRQTGSLPRVAARFMLGLRDLIIQHTANPRCQGRKRKGFDNQLDPGIEAAVVDDRISYVAASEEDFEPAHPPPRLVSELPAVHAAWQSDIREQEYNLAVGVQQSQRSMTVHRLENAIAQLTQHLDSEVSNVGVILNHQDSLSRSARNRDCSRPVVGRVFI
jgi:hypothetical protein